MGKKGEFLLYHLLLGFLPCAPKTRHNNDEGVWQRSQYWQQQSCTVALIETKSISLFLQATIAPDSSYTTLRIHWLFCACSSATPSTFYGVF